MGKKLTFKVHRHGEKELVDPRWREVEPENADCPFCRNKMAVIIGTKRLLYAYCAKCQKYFLGE